MSIESWLAEFYPISAAQIAKDHPRDNLVLIQHSLQKWQGVNAQNMANHGISCMPIDIESNDTSSLCRAYVVPHGDCIGCPVYESRGAVSCNDTASEEEYGRSPMNIWKAYVDQEPMIRALENASWFVHRHAAGRN
jgi:hypothetical protein